MPRDRKTPVVAALLIGLALFRPSPAGAVVVNAPTKTYLMAFGACDPSTACGDPKNHRVYVAESGDGISWSLVPGWQTYAGSVPDIIRREDIIYIYTPQKVTKWHLDTGVVDAAVPVALDDSESASGYVDPSLFLDPEGKLVLFYLQGILGQDPAGCEDPSGCTKRFRSATEAEPYDGTRFVADSTADRASVQIEQRQNASDPDIFFGEGTYWLYISGKTGSSTMVYSSTELRGTYAPVSIPPDNQLAQGTGGVPAGHYDANTDRYWTYAHTDVDGAQVIRLATHENFSRQLGQSDWTTVLQGSGIGLTGYLVGSPSFAVNVTGTPAPTPSPSPGDTTPPTVTTGPIPPWSLGTAIPLSWSANDDSGVAGYDVRYRSAPYSSSSFSSHTMFLADTGSTAAAFPPSRGRTYCFSARARDAVGNVSDWTGERCSTVPVNDRALKAKGSWTRGKGSGYYASTYSSTASKGATLTLSGVHAKTLAIILTKCKGCGTVDVLFGGKRVASLSASAAGTKKGQLAFVRFTSRKSGTLTLRAASSKRVIVEGVGVSLS